MARDNICSRTRSPKLSVSYFEKISNSNTTPKGGAVLIFIFTADAEYAEDFFSFLLSAEKPESKN
jgi:hypothetical protein